MTQEELLKEIQLKCYNKAGKVDGNIHNPKSKSYNPELSKELENHTSNFPNATIQEQIYVLKNNLTSRPKCYCGNDLPFHKPSTGYRQYCCGICQRKSPTKKEMVDNTWSHKTKEQKDEHVRRNKESKLRNHGDPNYNNGKKISQTLLSKSREEWEERNAKQRATKLERYGNEYYCNGDKISESLSNFTEEQREEIRLKKIANSLEKYGTEHPTQSNIVKDKQKETIIERYGVEHQMHLQEVKDKVQQTKEENNTLQNNPEIIDKAKQTNIKRYGAITFTASPEGKERVFATKEERYGDGRYCNPQQVSKTLKSKSDEEWNSIIDKRRETNIERYGTPSYAKSLERKRKYFEQTYDLYEVRYKENNISILDSKEEYFSQRCSGKFATTRLKCNICENIWEDRLHVNGCSSICRVCNPYKFTKEREIGEYLESIGIKVIYKDRKLIYPLEIDILLPDYKIGIEFNGLRFHSFGKSDYSMFNNFEFEREKKNNHLLKTELMEEQGYQLFHINEDEWDNKDKRDIWISMILSKLNLNERIFARHCVVSEIKADIAKDFLNINHMQGYTNSEIKIGLFYDNELLSVMTLGKPRYNKEAEYELIRFATKKYYNVIGGFGKLMKYFERVYNPKSILSYANRRWSIGKLYDSLNFKFIENTSPNYFYFDKSQILESRLKYQKHKLKDLLKEFDDTLSESENMYNNGYRKIYDCGNLKFVKEYNS